MRVSRLMLAPALLAAVGCMEGRRVIKVNADGSGTIVDTVKLGGQARSMIASMDQMDKTPAAEKKIKKDGKLKAQAAAMGEGVAFVSLQTTKDGAEQITYSFKDVSKIKVDTAPSPSDADSTSGKDEPLTFRFARSGGSSKLTVVFPKPAQPEAATPAPKPEELAQAIAMMKGMMAGLKMTTTLEVDGQVVKTNSPHASGSKVTLLEVDFDQLDEAGLKTLAASGKDMPSPAALKGVKGLKVNEGEVTVEFK